MVTGTSMSDQTLFLEIKGLEDYFRHMKTCDSDVLS